MTGLCLVPHSGFSGYSSHRSASLRLLPTEYVVVVLESTKDEKLLNRSGMVLWGCGLYVGHGLYRDVEMYIHH